jgi:predicted AAA+ superfamily ATPase
MSNHEIIGQALTLMREPLSGYILQQLLTIPEYKVSDGWWQQGVLANIKDDRDFNRLAVLTEYADRQDALDVTICLNLMIGHWPNLFKYRLPNSARSWISEIRDVRNAWAHFNGTDFTDKEAARALDTMALLIGEMDGETQEEIQKLYRTVAYGSEMGSMASTSSGADAGAGKKSLGVMHTTPMSGLPCWRNVIEPHPDVAHGRYKNAEFAADLAQVARGEGAYEYRDPVEFFSRTYVTEGMKGLLVQALRRVGGLDGEPVIQLKTAFGGGKTHSMLALYHMLRGRAPSKKIPNIKAVLDASEIATPPICRVAVLVGTALDPSKAKRPTDMPGITINTLWGEMAYQLAKDAGVPKLYDMIKESDKKGVSPGSETIKNLFDACGPCVILIDELVAYAKKLWKVDGLPAGSFDNLISFIQEITEAARASQNSLVVASIPESNIEIGEEGSGGQQALAAIEHTFGRMEAIWKPVAANEGFEIVRRRLFLDCKDESARDSVCQAFSQMYQENPADFPTNAKEVDYFQRMRSCYPIHPEIFDRLYEDWATIERFQKTRGVLRLMAAVVHNLWMNQDGGLFIMPGSISLDVSNIRDELTRHVGENWNAIVDHEVDGKTSIPYQKDQEITRFGKLMAARRVARTIMLGSAPSTRSDSIRGLETSRIRIGAVQPGENIATFNDALNTLQSSLTYLYSNPSNDRFWYDTRPTLRKTVEDRASQRSEEEVEMEIERRLKAIRKDRPFGRVHVCPDSSMDVSDEQDVGLVILKYRQTYKSNTPKDNAIQAAENILNTRGTSPRIYRNMLAFIAPDQNMMSALREEVKRFLAWKSIKEDSVDLNLDAAQNRETESSLNRSNQIVDARILETYCHLLVPYIDREVDLKTVIWDEISIRGGTDSIVTKAARKMQQNEQLITQWAPALLNMQLDNLLWQDRNDLNVGELWKLLCTYCYLPRLASFEVLQTAIQNGVNSDDYFAYADGVVDGRYSALKYNQYVGFIDRSGYLVKQVAALKQKAAEAQEKPVTPAPAWPDKPVGPTNHPPVQPGPSPDIPTPPQHEQPKHRHFAMTATLDTTRVVKNIGNLMDEVINHLMQIEGANVEIKLLVEATMPDGTPVTTVRTVTENCRTLKIDDFGFEE